MFLYVIKITTSASKKVDAVNFQMKQLLENRQKKDSIEILCGKSLEGCSTFIKTISYTTDSL